MAVPRRAKSRRWITRQRHIEAQRALRNRQQAYRAKGARGTIVVTSASRNHANRRQRSQVLTNRRSILFLETEYGNSWRPHLQSRGVARGDQNATSYLRTNNFRRTKEEKCPEEDWRIHKR